MKRIGNLYEKIIDLDNLKLAETKARKGKSKQHSVKLFDLNKNDNLIALHYLLKNKQYKTSEYTIFKIKDPKERIIYRLPFIDRIVHHAIMNILEPVFTSTFTTDVYNCIKKRGIHKALKAVKRALKDVESTEYALKIDIKKFYPSVNHEILKNLLRKKIKDKDLLNLLDEIIDSAPGIPIGNYLSQPFGNFYLAYFDHWIKEDKKVKNYFRYADDILILSDDKQYLHNLLKDIKKYLKINLKLEVKNNHQVFPVESRGIDFLGYKFFHDYTLLRKSIKKRFIRMINKNDNERSRAAYNGWLSWCNSINLQKKYLK